MVTVRIPTERQGKIGLGQGGYGCYLLQQAIGQPVTTALRRPLPLNTDLVVAQTGDEEWSLIIPAEPDLPILEARLWDPDCPTTTPVSIADAEAARAAAGIDPAHHPAPHCMSCGVEEGSLRVHAGPLGDGRWASPLQLPSIGSDGDVDHSLVWMAVDCASGWYTGQDSGGPGTGVTVQFAVDVVEPLEADTPYALVAWHGDHAPSWDGRKRGAAAAVFNSEGTCVVRARSFWVRPA